MQHLINNQEKELVAQEKKSPMTSLQDKLNQIKNWIILHPLCREIPSLDPELDSMMYWGKTYTRQLYAWLGTLLWESDPAEDHPDICFVELYVNFKLVTGGSIP